MSEPIKVTILPTTIWIENGFGGERVVVAQHEGMEPFDYAIFNYRYGYTDNASTHRAAVECAKSIGATEPVEMRSRPLPARASLPSNPEHDTYGAPPAPPPIDNDHVAPGCVRFPEQPEPSNAIRLALQYIVEADDAHALTQQLIDFGRAALHGAQTEPITKTRDTILELTKRFECPNEGDRTRLYNFGWALARELTVDFSAAAKLTSTREAIAKAIYQQWWKEDGYVLWEDRGNSEKQDLARRIADAALGAK